MYDSDARVPPTLWLSAGLRGGGKRPVNHADGKAALSIDLARSRNSAASFLQARADEAAEAARAIAAAAGESPFEQGAAAGAASDATRAAFQEAGFKVGADVPTRRVASASSTQCIASTGDLEVKLSKRYRISGKQTPSQTQTPVSTSCHQSGNNVPARSILLRRPASRKHPSARWTRSSIDFKSWVEAHDGRMPSQGCTDDAVEKRFAKFVNNQRKHYVAGRLQRRRFNRLRALLVGHGKIMNNHGSAISRSSRVGWTTTRTLILDEAALHQRRENWQHGCMTSVNLTGAEHCQTNDAHFS